MRGHEAHGLLLDYGIWTRDQEFLGSLRFLGSATAESIYKMPQEARLGGGQLQLMRRWKYTTYSSLALCNS